MDDRCGQLFTLNETSRPELLRAFAFYVRSRVTSGALHELDDLLTVARSIRATPWRSFT
jgi:hypothetical protein